MLIIFQIPLLYIVSESFYYWVRKIIKRVIKFDGSTEKFNREKIIRSIMRAGGSRDLGEEIVRVVEEKLGDQEEATTMQIRRIILIELEKKNRRDIVDLFLYFDRVVKGRITYETGKFIIIKNGRLFLGRTTRPIKSGELSSIDDVYALLDELDEDLWAGGLRKEYTKRRSRILMDAIRNSPMSEEDKKKAIKLVADFRRKLFERNTT